MSDKVKTQPNRAIEIYVGGKLIVSAIGNVTPSTDRPLTDVLAYGQSSPNSIVAGIQTYEVSLEIPGTPDAAALHKQILKSYITPPDLDDIFESGGIFGAQLPDESYLDQVPIIVLAQALDSRLLETGTPITDLIEPFVCELYYGGTVRQLLSMLDLGEAAFKKNLTLRMLRREMLKGPVTIDVFNIADEAGISGIDCAFELTDVPLRLIDGQYAFVLVNNEIWHKGFWYDSGNGLIVFDSDNDYCPEAPIALFLREEHTIATATVTLDNAPMANGLVITNEFDTVKYGRVLGAPGAGEFSYAGAIVTFNAANNGDIIHADYFHQGADVPFKNITVIYVTANPGVKAGDPFFPMTGALTP